MMVKDGLQEKTDVEGTLFVYTRSASPRHGFTIMNRLNMDNRTEPITKDLDFQLQDPFLLYRNAKLSIYGIWFYDKEECQRIAELMKNLTQQEQLKVNSGVFSPKITDSYKGKSVDILQMLTNAGAEYAKNRMCSEPKQITNSTTVCNNPNLIKPIPLKATDVQCQSGHQQMQPSTQTTSQLDTVEHLQSAEAKYQQIKAFTHREIARSLSYEEPSRLAGRQKIQVQERQLCPAIQKLMIQGTDLQTVSELPENFLCKHNNDFPSANVPLLSSFQMQCGPGNLSFIPTQDSIKTRNLLENLRWPQVPVDFSPAIFKASTSVKSTELGGISSCTDFRGTGSGNFTCCPDPYPTKVKDSGTCSNLGAITLGGASDFFKKPFSHATTSQIQGSHQTPEVFMSPAAFKKSTETTSHPSDSGLISPHELLKRLQTVQEEQVLTPSRPMLAAKFQLVSQDTSTLKPLDSWMDKTQTAQKQKPLFQSLSHLTIQSTTAPAVLMSPLEFTQSKPSGPKANESNQLPLRNLDTGQCTSSFPKRWPVEEPTPLTKLQLQETLLHLIKNDAGFLDTIYEAYLCRLSNTATKTNI
ncbi:mRNA-decapping enzyme 1B isoform X2 [Protopterus annectens]|uniref:mRNA-decapping enzyme 1B isoform X2 n=1 Tax=Protopterus annectens TaxID=7888 RepID=UPI001CFC2E75|nr:mRNA-decapping enzyme 1B isoform X2 [Protopterus annectens]